MRTTIDAAGRIVVPKALREELSLAPGTELEAVAVDGRLEIAVRATPMRLVERQGTVVAQADRSMPPLTDALVRDTLERTRR